MNTTRLLRLPALYYIKSIASSASYSISSVKGIPPPHRRDSHQAYPLTGFYLEILNHPLTPANAAPSRNTSSPHPTSHSSGPHRQVTTNQSLVSTGPLKNSTAGDDDNPNIIFGTRLAGPTEAAAHVLKKKREGRMVAGIWVPPKPVEPDNCCMSGCVNCVLGQFIEDLEEWKDAVRRVELRQKELDRGVEKHAGGDDRNQEKLVGSGGLWEGFEDIPIGLRVFMETERRLKKDQDKRGK